MDGDALRLLIVISARNAETTLASVLDRIPRDFVRSESMHVLVVDDASPDGTFQAGLDWAAGWTACGVSVLQNPRPQGYGGNLKLAFEYAVENRYEAVVLLHGDGKYAPERLPAIVEPILRGEADAVIGSRFLETSGPAEGGMPWLRRVTNRLLTPLQGRLLGLQLTDLHSGYRAYSTQALRAIPFQLNTDDLHFDTEVLIQLTRGSLRIAEVPIPTYYGDEISTRRGVAYVAHSLRSTLAAVFDSIGIKYRRQFDLSSGRPDYSPKLGYPSSHTHAIDAVPRGARVLDLGCGRGYIARELLAKGCEVVGVDDCDAPVGNLSQFIRWRLGESDELPFEVADFDYVLLLDIIEHLARPEDFLHNLRRSAGPSPPVMLLSVPNVGYFPMRLMLMLGQFNYGREGILDFTHTRLFTFGSLIDMLHQLGYAIHEVRGIPAPFPKAIGTHWLSLALVRLNAWFIVVSRRLFAYQLFLRIEPLPTVDSLLVETLRHTEERTTARAGESQQ
jgi:glycosyltransferase involved in cell wall biosynthesis